MATAYLNGKAGVWRTVGGRKIFIANGQSLKDAMRASGKFKNLKDDIKDMDEDDIKAELRNNRAKMKNASKEEDKELRLRNHKLMMELDRRWGEDEKKYKEQQNKKPKTNDEIDSRIAELEKKRDAQSFNNPVARDAQKEIDKLQKQKNKNSAKAALVDAEADFKYAQKTYPEDHTEYKQALKNYKQAIDDYEYAGGKVADSKKAKLGNTGDDADYKKAVFEDAKADFDFVKNEYPKDSAQYKRAKEAYDRAKYDVDKINKNQEVPTKYLDRGEMMNVVDKWSSKGFDEEGAFGNIGGRGVFHEKFASGQLEGWGGQEDDFVIKGFDLGSADPKVALKGLNDELNKVGYEAKYLKDEWYSHQDIEIKKIKAGAKPEDFIKRKDAKPSQSNNDSESTKFTMINNSGREVTVQKNGDGKWVDSDGNRYMGYLSKSDVKSYFKGSWKEVKDNNDSLSKQLDKTMDSKQIVAKALNIKVDESWKSTKELYKEQKGIDLAEKAIKSGKADDYLKLRQQVDSKLTEDMFNYERNFDNMDSIKKYAKQHNLDADALYYTTNLASDADINRLKRAAEIDRLGIKTVSELKQMYINQGYLPGTAERMARDDMDGRN